MQLPAGAAADQVEDDLLNAAELEEQEVSFDFDVEAGDEPGTRHAVWSRACPQSADRACLHDGGDE
eukprot:1603439-Heterocapsa_arctica.AAC.1